MATESLPVLPISGEEQGGKFNLQTRSEGYKYGALIEVQQLTEDAILIAKRV